LTAAAAAARLCKEGWSRLGRSACWRLPQSPRVRPCSGRCGWGRRPVGGCRGYRVFVPARGGAAGAVGLLAAAAVVVRLCEHAGVRLGR